MLTLFYYFHFIVLICVRVRYLRARSLSLAPPSARRPMARGWRAPRSRPLLRPRCAKSTPCVRTHRHRDNAHCFKQTSYFFFALVHLVERAPPTER